MKSIDLSEISALSPLMIPGSHDPIVVVNNGKTVAAVVPMDEEDVESYLLSINPKFQAILAESQASLEAEGPIPASEVRTQLGLPPRPTN